MLKLKIIVLCCYKTFALHVSTFEVFRCHRFKIIQCLLLMFCFNVPAKNVHCRIGNS